MKYLAQIILAVMFMHNKHILHRDIQTQNIFIGSEGILRLGDFGISREDGKNNEKAKNKTAVGTPYFMAPEVLTGVPYDQRADMWAIGIILYELITLKKPFDGLSVEKVFWEIMKSDFEPLPPSTDPNLVYLVSHLLRKDHN